MLDLDTWLRLGLVIAVVLLAAAVVWAGWKISHARSKSEAEKKAEFLRKLRGEDAGNSSFLKEQIRRYAQMNSALTKDLDGRKALADFYRSEIEVFAFLGGLEEIAESSDSYQHFALAVDEYVSDISQAPTKEGKWNRFKRGAKGLGGKVFGKVNDVVKGYLGAKIE